MCRDYTLDLAGDPTRKWFSGLASIPVFLPSAQLEDQLWVSS